MKKEIRKIILTRGIPGSGKSFWAKSWSMEDPEHRIRLNWDDMRNMMGLYWVPSREPINKAMLQAGLLIAMTEGYDIVIDNMNLNPKSWKEYEDIIRRHNAMSGSKIHYTLEFKDFFDTSLEECIKRDSSRPNPIGEKTIREIWKKYKHFIQTSKIENLVKNLQPRDVTKENCIVVDMDSTLCFNTSKRPWYGEGSTEAMINDEENRSVCEVIRTLSDSYPLILVTGRDKTQRDVTLEWLKQHDITIKECYFRNIGDFRSSKIYKQEQIEKILKDYNIIAIFEDESSIVNMYRELGLTVLQPN
jgi:predicted kinase